MMFRNHKLASSKKVKYFELKCTKLSVMTEQTNKKSSILPQQVQEVVY